MYRYRLNLLPTFLITICLFTANLHAQDLKNKLDRYIFDYQKNKKVPSISAGLLHNDKFIWRGAEGFADIENSVYASPRSVYRIASISKLITAIAIMQLVEKGKINLDVDARRYLPDFPKKKWKFTVRQLLNHTSGIRSYKNGEFDSKIYYASISEIVKTLAEDSLQFEPGTKYLYSTLAYNLLAAVIEKTSGMSFRSYLELNVFGPAQMYSTYLDEQPEIVPERASGYIKSQYRKYQNAPLADLSSKYPGGGIISNSGDLLRFGKNIINGTLIKPETLEKMFEKVKLKDGKIISYGLGCEIKADSAGRFYFGHTGGGTGFSSHLMIYPTEKLVTVSLSNIKDRNLDSPALDIAYIFLDGAKPVVLPALSDKLFDITFDTYIDSAIVFYSSTKKDSFQQRQYVWGFDELLTFGFDLLKAKLILSAIKFFKFLTNDFPQNADAYIGLAEAYQQDGNKGLASKFYKEAYRLAPNSEKLKKILGIRTKK